MPEAPLMLSVSGLRGLIGKSLTPAVAARYAAAVGQWLKSQANGGAAGDHREAPHVVLARDSRPSGAMIELAAASGLLAVGCRVTSVGIVTTPGAAVMVEHLRAHGGIVITASHNPIEWNGIKTLRHDGVAPPADQAQQIIDAFKNDDVAYAPVEQLGAMAHDVSAHHVHIQRILPLIAVDAIRNAKLKVVVDSVHGAGGPEARLLLDELGVELVHLYAEPTGRFPHTPEPLRENLTGLCAAVREHGAAIGFAQDPDADRLAVVDARGKYIGEEYTLALCALHMLEREGDAAEGAGVAGASGDATGGGGASVAANLSTSRMIDDVAARFGATVIRTAVGEANVAAAMRDHNCVAGGEGNGGVIWPKVTFVRDSLVGMALLLEMLATRGEPLSQIVASIPSYAIVKQKVDFDADLAAQLTDRMRDAFADEKLDEQDGVRLDRADRWVHVRPSNTEPILRIIAEAPDEPAALELIQQVRDALGLMQEA